MNKNNTRLHNTIAWLSDDKVYLYLGHIFFIAYLLGTLIYYKERLLNCDAGYYTFHMVNHEEVFVKHGRLISHFTQWFPIAMIKLGAGLKTVLITYSGSFGVWFYGLFLVAAHVFKSPRGGLFMALALGMTMRYKHYAAHTEITFALVVASLLYVWITCNKENISWYSKRAYWIILAILSCWLYIIHPIIILPLGILLGAEYFYGRHYKNPAFYISVLGILLVFGLKFYDVSQDPYESEKTSLLANLSDVWSNMDSYYAYHIVKFYFNTEYVFPLLVTICCGAYLLYRKHFMPVITMVLGTLVLLMVVLLTHTYLRGDVYYMIDGYLGMLGMVWAGAVYFFLRKSEKRGNLNLVLIVLTFFCMDRIHDKHTFFEDRLDGYTETLNLYPESSKLFVPQEYMDWDKIWFPYETPLESLILTSIEGKEHSRTLYIDYDNKGYSWVEGRDSTFLMFTNRPDLSELNPKFFKLPIGPYKLADGVTWK